MYLYVYLYEIRPKFIFLLTRQQTRHGRRDRAHRVVRCSLIYLPTPGLVYLPTLWSTYAKTYSTVRRNNVVPGAGRTCAASCASAVTRPRPGRAPGAGPSLFRSVGDLKL